MARKGGKKLLTELSRRAVHLAVHKALRDWDLPTREGFDFFTGMLVALENGFDPNQPIVDARIGLNTFIQRYISELGRLQPKLASLLTLRFIEGVKGRTVAYKLDMSVDHVNRTQRLAVGYLAGLIYDDELRRRKGAAPRNLSAGQW